MTATTTIRISTDTRDLLKALSARRGRSAGEVVAELVHNADDEQLLADAEADFAQMTSDPGVLSAYRAESDRIVGAFDADVPDW